MEEADAIGEACALGIAAGNFERCFGGINCGDVGMWPVMCQCNCDCTGAGSYIDETRLSKCAGEPAGLFYEMFGFGAGNQDVRCYEKRHTIEFGFADDVLEGFSALTPRDEIGVTVCLGLGEFLVRMGD